MIESGEEFLNRLYKDMYKSDEVMHGIEARFIGNKIENIKTYLDRMETLHNRIKDKHLPLLKEFYYQKYVIKKEDVPERYFELQKKIALERGYGHVEITEAMKKEMVMSIINDQKKSLDVWLNYFMSEDAKFYPFWAKYWAFQGMLQLGSYDKGKGEFNKRTKNTTNIFVDLNQEALSLSIDFLLKSLNKEEINDKQLEVLLKGGSFKKIYTYIIKKLEITKKEFSTSNAGEWIKYNRGTDYMPLVKSLEGKGTGWCTAGEKTAQKQLEGGDFYVYYSYDKEGKPTIPRIAIRMNKDKIGEIRGVAQGQNIEPEMEQIVDKKLEEFPDRDAYKKKVSDMEKLTQIYKKHQQNDELTNDDLTFLYEINDKISGFGYRKDPRIAEIIKKRNIKKDLAHLFKCSEREIAITPEKIGNRKIVCYHGTLDLPTLNNAERSNLPEMVNGDLNLGNLSVANGLKLPRLVNGDLNFGNLTVGSELELPTTVNKNLYLESLKSAIGIKLPKIVRGALILSSIESADGLVLPETIGGDLVLNSLINAQDLKFPRIINGSLALRRLTNADNLKLPETINGNLDLYRLTSANGLTLPKKVNGDFELGSLTSVKGLKLPETVNGNFDLGSLTSTDGLELPKALKGSIKLSSLTSAKDLKLPKTINGDLDLFSLTSAEGLRLPETINGSLYLDGLISARGLELPEVVNGYLTLSSIKSAKDLKLPKTINGDLNLFSLTSAEGLKLPEIIGGNLNLSNLKSIDDLEFPKTFKGSLFLDKLVSAKGLVIPETCFYVKLSSLTSMDGIIIPPDFKGIIETPNLVKKESRLKRLSGRIRQKH